jgi:ParB family chromosome partitioning protein
MDAYHQEPINDQEPITEVQPPVQIRRRLGRGLNALLGEGGSELTAIDGVEPSLPQGELRQIPVNAIERNPFQPRTEFEESGLRELSDSIHQHGVLQPLLVRALDNGGWQLIAGERRWLAAKQAGLSTVPCRVLDLIDQQVCEVALEENLKRKDLNVLEKATAFHDYLQRFGSSAEELAKQLSLDRSTIANMLRLLELPEVIRQALLADKITASHARALLSLPEAEQLALCERIQKESLSVRATESAVRQQLVAAKPDDGTVSFADAQKKRMPEPTQHVLSLQSQLRDMLGVPVEIKLKGKESGQIVITFGSNDDFERVLRVIRRAA